MDPGLTIAPGSMGRQRPTIFRGRAIMRLDRRRWTLGLAVSDDCRTVRGAAIAAYGSGFEARLQVAVVAHAAVPLESRKLFRQLARARTATSQARRLDCAMSAVLAAELADVQAAVVRELMAREPLLRDNALLMGIHDPGLWYDDGGHRAYLGLCDGCRLAELTGLNVLDAFPARDLAQGGQGGPLLAAGYWMLAHDVDRPRAILHLGPTTRCTYLPAARDASGIGRIVACDIGAGTQLFDLLAGDEAAPAGPDRHGPLAAQGRLRVEYLDAWLSNPGVKVPAYLWHPHGIDQRTVAAAILQRVQAGALTRADALCTAIHWVAQAIAERLGQSLPLSPRLAEIVLTGRGRHNRLLIDTLGRLLPDVKLLAEPDIPLPAGSLDPASAAVLAQLFLEQVPGNQTAVSGAQVPRVLGRLTPGAPQNWLRLVREMARHQPVVTLRTAI